VRERERWGRERGGRERVEGEKGWSVVGRSATHLLVERRGVCRVRRRVVEARILEVFRRQALGGLHRA